MEERDTPQEKAEKKETTLGEIIIITGLSGAGKSLALKCFEDLEFFCVDNLLPALIPKFVQLCAASDLNQIALVIDIRGRRFFKELISALKEIPDYGFRYQILFLEASDEVLVRRFSETRRRHPLALKGRLLDGISFERKQLEEIKALADRIIDSTSLSPSQLKRELTSLVVPADETYPLNISIVTFGFKFGIPLDIDLLYDVRFLPNPHYIAELQNLSGNNDAVRDYVLSHGQTQAFLQKLFDFNEYLMPQYVLEGKSSLTIGVGCTGGKHRSIVIGNELAKFLEGRNYRVHVEYRDLKIS
ncbi:MAG: RNase adapter RapZ [Candidatus Eremiobacteraeota bacterium]|nr:RNase adapter RapZ [Candidatus Eremiobacteraeota bacterium]